MSLFYQIVFPQDAPNTKAFMQRQLLRRVITSYDGDFLGLFNGERVVAKREKRHLYLNTESSIWKKEANLVLLATQPYEIVTYPVV